MLLSKPREKKGDLGYSWPAYPQITTTLLAAVTVAGVFVGIGSLTQQTWMFWLGLLTVGGVMGSHILRYWSVRVQRRDAREAWHAQLICQCSTATGTGLRLMQGYFRAREPVLLILTENALHLSCSDQLQIVHTIPLYNIVEAQVVQLPMTQAASSTALHLSVHSQGNLLDELAFYGFERHAPASLWVTMIEQIRPPFTKRPN
jgi:hypothetical protein